MTTLHKVTMFIPFDGDPGSVLDLAQELAVQLTEQLDESDEFLLDEDVLESVRNSTCVSRPDESDDDAKPDAFRPTTIDVSSDVSLKRIATLLCSAFEGGVGYWCRIMDYREPPEPEAVMDELYGDPDPKVFPHIDYPLQEGGAVVCRLTDRDSSDTEYKPLVLDFAAVERGVKLMPEKSPREWARFIDQQDDATTGDAFLQCCLLGDVIYG